MASTADTTDRGHPISAAVARMRAEIGGVAEQPAWSMGAEETRAAVAELTRLAAQVTELELRVSPTPTRSGWATTPGRPRPRTGWRTRPG